MHVAGRPLLSWRGRPGWSPVRSGRPPRGCARRGRRSDVCEVLSVRIHAGGGCRAPQGRPLRRGGAADGTHPRVWPCAAVLQCCRRWLVPVAAPARSRRPRRAGWYSGCRSEEPRARRQRLGYLFAAWAEPRRVSPTPSVIRPRPRRAPGPVSITTCPFLTPRRRSPHSSTPLPLASLAHPRRTAPAASAAPAAPAAPVPLVVGEHRFRQYCRGGPAPYSYHGCLFCSWRTTVYAPWRSFPHPPLRGWFVARRSLSGAAATLHCS